MKPMTPRPAGDGTTNGKACAISTNFYLIIILPIAAWVSIKRVHLKGISFATGTKDL